MRPRQITSQSAPFTPSGSSAVGQPLTVRPGKGWAATGGNVGQWYLDGVAVSGQTTYTYTPVSGDLGKVPTFVPVGLPYTVTFGVVSSPPVITTAAVIAPAASGQAVTWSAAVATGTPAPALTYSLRKNGVEVATTSGTYTNTVTGDVLQVVTTATNTAGQVTNNSATVVVGDVYMIATHRLSLSNNVLTTGTATVGSGQQTILGAVTHYLPDYDQYGLQLTFVGYTVTNTTNAEVNLANDVTYTGVSIELNGVRYPQTLNGSTSFTIPAGSTGVLLDPMPDNIIFPANGQFREIVLVQNQAIGAQRLGNALASTDIPNTAGGLTDGLMVNNGSTDLTSYLTGTAAIALQFASVLIPSASCITAKGWAAANAISKRAICVIAGDSIGQGFSDGNYNGNLWPARDGVYGDTSRGLSSRTLSSAAGGAGSGSSRFIPHLNCSVFGTTFAVASQFTKRMATFALLDYPWTTVWSEIGSNENTTGSTLQAKIQAHVDFWRSQVSTKRPNAWFVQSTIWGRATATAANIGFAQVSNQTANSTSAANINPLIRSGAITGINAWVERTGIVHATRTTDDYAWLPGSAGTLSADYAGNATTMDVNFVPNAGEVMSIGEGTANVTRFFIVKSVAQNTPSAGTNRVTGALAGTTLAVATGGLVTGVRTVDGIHGQNTAYQLVAEQAIIPNKFKAINPNT